MFNAPYKNELIIIITALLQWNRYDYNKKPDCLKHPMCIYKSKRPPGAKSRAGGYVMSGTQIKLYLKKKYTHTHTRTHTHTHTKKNHHQKMPLVQDARRNKAGQF